MFAKSKSSGSTPSVLLPNPLQNLYDVGKQTATAGPENAWRIYNGYTKADRKVILDRPIIPFRNVCFKSETLEIYSPRLFSSRNNRTSNYNSLEKVLLSKSIRNYLLFYYYIKILFLKINSFPLSFQEVSIFFFDKRSVDKLHKPKRKEAVTEILRNGARQMERVSHPKILQVRCFLFSFYLLFLFFFFFLLFALESVNRSRIYLSHRHTRSKNARIVWRSLRSRSSLALRMFQLTKSNERTTSANRRLT